VRTASNVLSRPTASRSASRADPRREAAAAPQPAATGTSEQQLRASLPGSVPADATRLRLLIDALSAHRGIVPDSLFSKSCPNKCGGSCYTPLPADENGDDSDVQAD